MPLQFLRGRLGGLRLDFPFAALRQIWIEEAEHVGALNYTNALLLLQVGDALVERFHFRPMDFRAEMVFGVVAVVEKEPVVNLAVTAHAPRHRFVRIGAIMAIVTIQVAKAVAEIEKRQKEENVAPVKKEQDKERGGKRR